MARIYPLRRKSTLALRQRKERLVRQLAVPPQAIRASVVERFGTCGKANCACHRGRKHGPYYYLTQCLAPGEVRKFLLKAPAEQQAARAATAAFNAFYEAWRSSPRSTPSCCAAASRWSRRVNE